MISVVITKKNMPVWLIALLFLVMPAPTMAACVATSNPEAALSRHVFDVTYYKKYNPDLASLSDGQAQTHWLQCGINEGRRAYPLFWSKEYLELYPSVAQPGASLYDNALQTYVSAGYGQGLRNGGQAGVLALGPNVFNIGYYVQSHFPNAGSADTDAEIYWITTGLALGQQSAPWFSTPDYLFLNHDKAIQFGTDYQAAIDDYQLLTETQPAQVASRVTAYALSPIVFDPTYYAAHAAAAIAAYSQYCATLSAAQQPLPLACQYASSVGAEQAYWLTEGLHDGDKASENFSAQEYMQQNPARVSAAKISTYPEALRDYIQYGRSLGLAGLVQTGQNYLDYIPTSRPGLKLSKDDHIVSFTSAGGKQIKVVVQAPVADNASTFKVLVPEKFCTGQEDADDFFNDTFKDYITKAAGYKTLEIAHADNKQPCQFRLSGKYIASTGSHIYLSGVKDLAIDFNGATLNFSKPSPGLVLYNLTRVVLENLTIDWPDLRIASIGQIVVDDGGNHYLKIIKTYPNTPISANDKLEYLSRWDLAHDTWAAANGDESWATDAVYVGHQCDRASASSQCYSASEFAQYPAGTVLVARHYMYEGPAISLANGTSTPQPNTDIEFKNIQVNSAPGMAMALNEGQGIWINNYHLKRLDGRILSSTADGLNLSATYGDVIVENSDIGYQGDDGLNIGGTSMMPVLSVAAGDNSSGPTLNLGAVEQSPVPGDRLMFLNSALGTLGFAKVTKASLDENNNYLITVSGSIPATLATDSLVQDLATVGARYVIQNNALHNNRARGIVDQSPYGLVQNNQIYYQSIFAALIGSLDDVQPGCGVGVEELTFQNNVIDGSEATYENGGNAGSVLLTSYLTNEYSDESGSTDVAINKNIVFNGNRFQNLPGPALFLGSASAIDVANNSVVNANLEPGYWVGTADTTGSIVVSQAHDIAIADNFLAGDQTGRVSIDAHSTSNVQQSQDHQPAVAEDPTGINAMDNSVERGAIFRSAVSNTSVRSQWRLRVGPQEGDER